MSESRSHGAFFRRRRSPRTLAAIRFLGLLMAFLAVAGILGAGSIHELHSHDQACAACQVTAPAEVRADSLEPLAGSDLRIGLVIPRPEEPRPVSLVLVSSARGPPSR